MRCAIRILVVDDDLDSGEEDFEVLREVGTKPSFAFTARDHLDLSQVHGWRDSPRGTKASGSRFVYRLGDLALLEMALYRYALARVTQQGHIPMLPPVLVREEATDGAIDVPRVLWESGAPRRMGSGTAGT